ncbi:MAG: nicotinamide riboside transporter PnuC [Muribaculaceae bacterium]|nr:nicotinamide riboside transporter PnuC [Muribaculaceae bacterium]
MTIDLALEILGFLIGLLYLWWEYHANAKVWIASVIMPAISMWIYYSKGLYADFGINIYYLLIAVYGFIHWTRKPANQTATGRNDTDSDQHSVSVITHIPGLTAIILAAVSLALWGAIWWILVTFTDSTVPVADSFTTSLSIVGLWMLARKYIEQWFVWLLVDIVCSALYLYKGLDFYCVLYAIYTIISILGYRKWLRLMRTQSPIS